MQENAPTLSCIFFKGVCLSSYYSLFKGLINFYYLSLSIYISFINILKPYVRGYTEILQYTFQALLGESCRKRFLFQCRILQNKLNVKLLA